MQHRETKVVPLPSGQWSVEICCSDNADELMAKNVLRFRCAMPEKPKHPMVLLQREALTVLYTWMQDEIERLRMAQFS